jgi:NAD(P)-dependent dehydrogenase (short-subunit alcohol dehydrogenase family)
MSLLTSFKRKGPSGFGSGSTAEDVTEGLDLSGRTILVTGCNSGIGHETVRVLAKRGARVIATARTEDKARAAAALLGKEVVPLACELSSPSSVRGCIAAVKARGQPLDAIICNAGIMALPKLEMAFGYELQFFTNHIGHFLLVTGLLDQLAEQGRVVMVASEAHRRAPPAGVELDNLSGKNGYNQWTAYGQSKTANILFARQLAKRLAGTKKTANAVHPGVISTNLVRNMPAVASVGMKVLAPLFFKSVAEGAATQCFVATRPELAGVSGEYFVDCNIAEPRSYARDAALAERLWQESERIVSQLP